MSILLILWNLKGEYGNAGTPSTGYKCYTCGSYTGNCTECYWTSARKYCTKCNNS